MRIGDGWVEWATVRVLGWVEWATVGVLGWVEWATVGVLGWVELRMRIFERASLMGLLFHQLVWNYFCP